MNIDGARGRLAAVREAYSESVSEGQYAEIRFWQDVVHSSAWDGASPLAEIYEVSVRLLAEMPGRPHALEAGRLAPSLSLRRIHTAEVSCSIAECCCSWSYSGFSLAEAEARLEESLAEQGAVRAKLGATDADGNEIESVFCRLCWEGLQRVARGAA